MIQIDLPTCTIELSKKKKKKACSLAQVEVFQPAIS
jgi:hypothetical protein